MKDKLRNWITVALVVAVILLSTVLRPERVVIVEDESCQQELAVCQEQRAEDRQLIAALQQEIIKLTTSPNISVEKWLKVDGDCGWQKEISAEKGDWVEFRVVVSLNGTMNNVWGRDAALARDPWTKVQGLQVDGIPVSGDIAERISLGKLTDEAREITFKALLSKSTYRYSCGENVLENLVETGDCGFETAASEVVRIMIDIHCTPPSGGGGSEKPEIIPPEVHTDPNG